MTPARLAEIRARVEDVRGSLSTRITLKEVVEASEVLKAHANLDLPELMDAYDRLREEAAELWGQLHPHAEDCAARGREVRPVAPCGCDRRGKPNPYG